MILRNHCTILLRVKVSCETVLTGLFLFLFREAQGVLACCNPVPTLVKQYVNEIHMLIVEAKQLALTANKVYTSHLHAYTIVDIP